MVIRLKFTEREFAYGAWMLPRAISFAEVKTVSNIDVVRKRRTN